MALVKYGGGVVQMSGSVGGDTFARNRFGNYVRARTKPINPNSAGQQAVRAALTLLTQVWASTLTAAQRTAWNLYASNVAMKNRLSQTIHLTGFNHFIRSNNVLARFGGTPIAAGPVIFELPEKDPTLSLVASEAGQQISISWDNGLPWADEDGAFIYFYQGQPQNTQRNFFDGPWRYLGGISGINGAPVAPPAPFVPKWAIAEGQRQWIYARIFRADGRLSEVFRADTFCTA